MREPGYYWVKYEGEWEIGHYRLTGEKTFHTKEDIYSWTLPAYIDDSWWHSDEDFDEIDERRIVKN